MSEGASDLEIVVRAGADYLASDLSRMSQMMRKFARDAEIVPTKADIDTSGLARARNEVRELGAAVAKTSYQTSSFFARAAVEGAAFSGMMVAIQAGVRGIGGMFDTIRESVVKASDFEQTKVGFEVMLQSAEKATGMLADLRKYSSVAPFTNESVTESARSLLAYGVAADQILPTIKMLGDISSGLGKNMPLDRMTYLYGKTFSTQRAYAVELREFAMGGIPIWDELSKVLGKSVNELEKFAEEGGIGRDEVTKAFINMTQAGGRFHDMVSRQGKTLAGLWTTAIDGADLLKRNFGEIVIEEVGLKDVVKDLTSFANNVNGGLDRLRPMVHFIGDLVKGGAQLTYEFGKAGMVIADLNWEGLANAFPAVSNSLNSAREWIADLQNFKIDPKKTTAFALNLFEDVGGSLAQLVDFAEHEGRGFADGFQRNFANPIKDMITDLREVRYSLRELVGDASGAYNMVGKAANPFRYFEEHKLPANMRPNEAAMWALTDEGRMFVASALKMRVEGERNNPVVRNFELIEPLLAANSVASGTAFPLPRRSMTDNQQHVFIDSYRELSRNISEARASVLAGHGNAMEALDLLLGRRNDILRSFGVGRSNDLGDLTNDNWGKFNHQLVVEGKIPWIKNEIAPPSNPLNAADRFRDFFGGFKNTVLGRQAESEANQLRRQQEETARQSLSLADSFRQLGIGSLLAVDPLNRLAGAVSSAAIEFDRQKATGGILGGLAGVMSQNLRSIDIPRLQGDIPGNLVNLANKLNTEFKLPTKEDIDAYKLSLDQLSTLRDKVSGKPLIDDHVKDMAWGKYLTEAATRMGIGTEVKLPGVAVAGSVEDARLLAQFKVQNTSSADTPESLLRRILDFLVEKAAEMEKREVISRVQDAAGVAVHLW